MYGHYMREGCPDILYFQGINHKVRELNYVLPELFVFQMMAGIVKETGKIGSDISGAGCRRSDHRAVVLKISKKLLTQLLRLLQETIFICKLAATGLIAVVKDSYPKLLQNPDHVHPCLRINLIDETGNENVDKHGKKSEV